MLMKKIIILILVCLSNGFFSFSQEVNIHYDVYLIPQIDNTSCWAASSAMVLSYKSQTSITVESVKKEVNTSLPTVDISSGLYPDDTKAVGDLLGLSFDYPQCYGVQGFADLLSRVGGPVVFIKENGGGGAHAILIYGIKGDGTDDGTIVEYLDPWPPNKGVSGTQNFASMMESMEKLGFMDQTVWKKADGSSNDRLYVLYQKKE